MDDFRPAIDGAPDPHGHAAILLIESVLHTLIARGVITIHDAVEAVETAADVKNEIGSEMGDTQATLAASLAILKSMSASLSIDVQPLD